MDSAARWAGAHDGARAVAPMLVGVVPFGLVAGAAPADAGFGVTAALGFSTIVFAGASQLAAVDVLRGGGSVLVAVIAAWTINLRMLLYSASLAPYLAGERLPRRLLGAYLLVDQVYALAITRWPGERDPASRVPFMVGAGALLWSGWVAATLVGALAGPVLPDRIPLDFAVPLVFLVVLVPTLTTRPAAAAALAGGLGAVLAGEAGAGHLSIIVGASAGIAAGAVADVMVESRRARPRREPPPPHETGPAP